MSKPKWSVGVVTAPRKNDCYLGRTLKSLQAAGWEPIVFAEPESPIPDDFHGTIVRRRKPYGDWANWATALYDLLLSEPDSDYFFMAEDDSVTCKNLAAYLEDVIPKLPEFAYLSLYTGSELHRPKIRGFHNESHGGNTRSTVAILLEREKVEMFLGNEHVMRHRKESIGTTHDNTSKDYVMGLWAETTGLPVYYHSPSLTEHIGVNSMLLWARIHIEQWRNGKEYSEDDYPCSKDFVGEDFDASQWVGKDFDVRNTLGITLR